MDSSASATGQMPSAPFLNRTGSMKGELASLVAGFPWGGTPLGPADSWPQALRTLADLMLAARQPMFIVWGPEYRLLYNDAYAEILAGKHPEALGRPMLEVWSEIRDQLAPMLALAMSGVPVHMDKITLRVERRGYPEETHFAFSYTPVPDDKGGVAGVFCACVETTQQVRLQRALSRSEARASALLESIADGFIAVSRDWRIIFLSTRGRELLRIAPSQGSHEGQLLWDAFPDLLGTPFEAAYRRAMNERIPASVEAHYAALDTWFDLRVHPSAEGISALFLDVGTRKRAEHQRELLIHELNHRVKNTLAIVQAIAGQSFRGGPGITAFQDRLQALAAAHNLLTRASWERVLLGELAEQVLAGACGSDGRITLDGPEVELQPKEAITFAMALHELCTNAVKHGALSASGGRVHLEWRLHGPRPARLQVTWSEAGGPPAAPPERQGFGLRMIEQALAIEFSGKVRLDFRAGGLVCVLDGVLPDVARGTLDA